MKYLDWSPEKNAQLFEERDISFEEVVIAIGEGCLLDIVEHPNPAKYPDQQIFVVQVYDYVYLVPFIEDNEKIFLKTIIPSRKATKKYLTE